MGGRTSTSWKPGQSGNPRGQPKRPFAKVIERVGNRRVNGKTNKIRKAEAMWQLVNEGRVEFPDGSVIEVQNVSEWLDVIKHMDKHIDGDPPTEHDVNMSGGINLILDAPWNPVKTPESQS